MNSLSGAGFQVRDVLSAARLYGIMDLDYVAQQDVARVASLMIEGGIHILQLRAKKCTEVETIQLARLLCPLCEKKHVPLIINDHPQLTGVIGAAGAHVGQEDVPLSFARRLLRHGAILGRSTHSLDEAVAAEKEGADYIGFGPLFSTPTKPDYRPIGLNDVAEAHRRVKVPVFCIGGIKVDNLQRVVEAGARRVVIVSGILLAPDIPGYIARCAELLPA